MCHVHVVQVGHATRHVVWLLLRAFWLCSSMIASTLARWLRNDMQYCSSASSRSPTQTIMKSIQTDGRNLSRKRHAAWNRTVEHLDDSVLHVDFALVALAEDFQLLQHLRALQHYIATAVEYRLCGPADKASGAEASLGAASYCTDGSRMARLWEDVAGFGARRVDCDGGPFVETPPWLGA